MGGLIAKLLSFTRVSRNDAKISDVKLDPGGEANITAQHFADSGDDSHPLPTDFVHGAKVRGSWRWVAAGYVDPLNEPKAQAGEKRIYGRDSSGTAVNEVWLKNDGSILISNDNGSCLLDSAGTIKSENTNGSILLDSSGLIESANTIAKFSLAPTGSIKGENAGGAFELAISGDFLINGAKITSSGDFVDSSGKTLSSHTHKQGDDDAGDIQVDVDPPT